MNLNDESKIWYSFGRYPCDKNITSLIWKLLTPRLNHMYLLKGYSSEISGNPYNKSEISYA